MTLISKATLVASVWIFAAGAQDPSIPVLRPGVFVNMPVADHTTEMRAADANDAVVVAITATGKMFLGTTPTEPAALAALSAETVYLKADSRVPYQQVLSTLDALRGKSVVLLTAPPSNAERRTILPPYGMRLIVAP